MKENRKRFIVATICACFTFVGCDEKTITHDSFEKPDDTKNTKINECLLENYTDNSTRINIYRTGKLTAVLERFGEIPKPENTEYTSYIHYEVFPNGGNSQGKYSVNFINFSEYIDEQNTRVTKSIKPALYEEYRSIDWTNASVSFWIFNTTDLPMSIYGTDTDFDDVNTPEVETVPTNKTESEGKKIKTVYSKTWTKVTASLTTYCNITSDVIASGEYNIKFWLSFTDEKVTNVTCTGEESWSFYMTGFEFVSPQKNAK